MVDQQSLHSSIKIHEVTQEMRIQLLAADPQAATLDEGEKDLLSYVRTQPNVFLLCAPDKAAIRSTYRLNLLDQLVSLEQLTWEAGIRKQGYGWNHTKDWLAGFKTKVKLGIL